MCISILKGGYSHDEVVHKLIGKRPPSSIHIVVPLVIHDLIFLGILDINLVEDDLTEVDVGDLDALVESGVEKIGVRRDDCGCDVEL